MRKRFSAGLLAAAAVAMAAGFMLPASAAARNANRTVRAYAPKGGVMSAASLVGAAGRPQHVDIAWTTAAAMPVAVEETGGGAGTGKVFYVPGGYKAFPHTLNNTVQKYSATTNTWTNDTSNPIPTIPGLVAGQADSTACWDPVGKQLHIVNGVGYDSLGNGFIVSGQQEYNPAAPTGSRWTALSAPILSNGNRWFGQDAGCSFVGGKMYLYGGYGCNDTPGCTGTVGILTSTWVFDPVAGTWSDTGFPMMHARLWMGYTGSAANAYAAGGSSTLPPVLTALASTEKFTPASGWVATANLPVGLVGPGEGNVSTHLLVYGGQNSSGTTQVKTYACTIPACTSFMTTAFNLPAASAFGAFGSGSDIFNAGGTTSGGIAITTAEHLP